MDSATYMSGQQRTPGAVVGSRIWVDLLHVPLSFSPRSFLLLSSELLDPMRETCWRKVRLQLGVDDRKVRLQLGVN
jgi:hypothetical protein